MSGNLYSSVLAEEMVGFVRLRTSQNFKDGNKYILNSLDDYLLENNILQKELSPTIIDGWLSVRCKDLSVKTKNCYVAYYSQFARHLHSLGIGAFIPENHIVKQSYIPYVFSSREIDAIFKAADHMEVGEPLSRVQFPMLLRLLYGCGLRLGEALSLRFSDVDVNRGIIRICYGKSNKDRLVPTNGTLTKILRDYCGFAKETASTFLFEGNTGSQRFKTWAQKLFRDVLQDAGIELLKQPTSRNICLHCLRHTFAVDSFRMQDLAGTDNYRMVPLLSIYLGHNSLLSTQKYLHMTDEISNDILDAANRQSRIFPEVPR